MGSPEMEAPPAGQADGGAENEHGEALCPDYSSSSYERLCELMRSDDYRVSNAAQDEILRRDSRVMRGLRSDPEPDLWSLRADLSQVMSTTPPGRDWFIEDRFERGRGALLSGIGGSSKTRLLYYLAIGGVIGRLPWHWKVSATGSAVLVLTEDTQRDLHETLQPVCRCLDITDDERQRITDRLIVFPMAGEDFRLLDSADGRTLVRTSHHKRLQGLVKELGDAVFVGLDPALALTSGDELDQGHQRTLGKTIDDLAVNTGASVVMTAHATKGSLGQDELSSHSSRGGGAITDAVRGEFAMRTMTAKEATWAGITDTEERKRHVQLVATKGNHLPPSAYVPVWLRRGEGGTLSETQVTLQQSNRGPSRRDRNALAILVRMQQNGTPKVGEWRAECSAQNVISGKNEDAEKKAMQRVVNNLRDAELIEKGMGYGIWVPTDDGRNEVEEA